MLNPDKPLPSERSVVMTADQLAWPPAAAGRCAVELPLRTKSRAWRVAGVGAPGAFALAALSGALYAAAFPPLSWPLAAWLALVPLLIACAALSPLGAALAGMCWTTTMAAGVGWFLPAMLSHYFGLAAVPSLLASVGIAAGLHGLYVSTYAAWVAWLVRRRAANPVLLAGGWLVCEFARAHGVLGSPWALTAYSQLAWTPLIQIADLAGPYGIGMLVAGVNAGAAALLVPALRGRRPLRGAATIAAALAAALIYGQWRLGQTFGDGAPVRVAVVQGGAPPAEKAQRAARLARYVALTTSAGTQADLIVWPEYAVEAYLQEATRTRDTVLQMATAARADLILGGPHYTPSASGTRYHNSIYLVRDGRLAARYDKHQLVPFAEDDRLEWLLGAKTTSYAPGPGEFVLSATSLRVGAFLCLEAMFPDLVREAVRQGAEVLVNLSNDAWFGHPEPARHQLEIATLRAVENRRYLVRAASTGFSAVIDPYGRTLAQSEFNSHAVLNATVRASHARTPYQRWGDALAWMVIAGVVGASLRPLLNRTVRQTRRRSSMKQSRIVIALALCLAVGSARAARAGAPQPDTRQGDFVHACKGGPNKAQACTVATQAADCPKSECVVQVLSKAIKGRLTLIAHDSVTDWQNGGATNRALTVMLEVKAPDGSRQMLAATYQNLASPTDPPEAPSNVVSIPIDESAVQTLSGAVNGLLFAQPESALSVQLQTLFASTGTPAIVAAKDTTVQSADHTGDDLATVLRFKVKIQFLDPL